MQKPERWFVPVFLGVVVAAAAAAAACGEGPSNPAVLISVDSSGGDSIPGDSTPGDSTPGDSIPRDSIPRDSIPRDSIPRDSVPRDTTPPPLVTSLVVTPSSQERIVGDSGEVMATLRDSAGREVFVQHGLTWDLRDTAGVLQAFVGGPHVFFYARGPGRATLIARYEALADTGVVVVTDDSTPPPPPPPPGLAASITVTPDSQERAVGDSVVVSAWVHDSGGTLIWPVEISWDLRDTTAVLRLDHMHGTYHLYFTAVGPGRARLIARHQTLADTGVVVVR